MNSKFKNSIHVKNLIVLLLILLSSCASRKDYVYFQDEPIKTETENFFQNTQLTYNTNDLLIINVAALDPEAAKPFNLPVVPVEESIINGQGILKLQTYLIDINGHIEFPVLGSLKIGGMTRTEATDYLKDRLKEYIKNPIVNIRLANFTISVIGEVNTPGTFVIQDEKVTLNQALGLAGDLTIYGKRNNVFLIRDINGEKSYTKLDLTSINVMNSPVYYLAQNDVIYVEPNKSRIRSATFNPNTAVIISAISTLATIAAILIR